MSNLGRLIGLFLIGGGIGTLLFKAAPHHLKPQPKAPAPIPPGWRTRVVRYVSKFEGGSPGACNRNTDGSGLSYGLIQWTQKSGNLGILLNRMMFADPQTFTEIFGIGATQLVEQTRSASQAIRMSPVGGLPLWDPIWVQRFKAATEVPRFIQEQWDLARTGDHMQGAIKAAKILDLKTLRALTLLFDLSVQEGPGSVMNIATNAASYPPEARLSAVAWASANRWRSSTRKGPDWRYVEKNKEWHRFAGNTDLYEDVARRRFQIVKDPLIPDTDTDLEDIT